MTDLLLKIKDDAHRLISGFISKESAKGGNHGGQGQGSSTGVGHFDHGQGLGLGHSERPVSPITFNSPVQSPGFLQDVSPVRPGHGRGPGPKEVMTLDNIMKGKRPNKDMVLPSVVLQISDNYPNVDPNLITKLVEDVWAYGHVISGDNDGKVVAVDFDGTIAHWAEFPMIGGPVPGAIEALNKLVSEGWKVVIHSHRAAQPGGKDQIAAWCISTGLQASAIVPKIYARWYIDDRAIECRDNWRDIYNKLHYDVPVQIAGPKVTVSDIVSGEVPLNQIAEDLGFNGEELRKDISAAYGPHTPESATIVESLLREKYGITASIKELDSVKDTTGYWLSRLAEVKQKREGTNISVGDSVLFTAACPYTGEIGIVLDQQGDSLEVQLDGPTPRKVKADRAEISFVPATTRIDPAADNVMVIRPSSLYPEGVRSSTTSMWYGEILPRIESECFGRGVSAVYYLNKESSLCVDSEFNKELINTAKLISLDLRIPAFTDTTAIRFRPTAGVGPALVKSAMLDIIDSFVDFPKLKDVKVRFGGADDYYLILDFSEKYDAEAIRTHAAAVIKQYIAEYGSSFASGSKTAEPGKLMIDSDIRTIPASFSLNRSTGLVCVPLDVMKLDAFTPEDAALPKFITDDPAADKTDTSSH